MYPEFIAIYIGLVIVIALLVTILVLLIKRTGCDNTYGQKPNMPQTSNNWMPNTPGAVVFCKYCGTQFDSSQNRCPKCGNFR